MKATFNVATAVGWRMLHNNLTTPSLLIPGLAFPLFFFMAFAGGLSRVNEIPGFRFPSGYTAFQFVFVLLQSAAFAGVFTGFGIVRDFETGFMRRLMLAAPNRKGIVLGYAFGALGRWLVTATVLTVVALLVGMRVGGNGVDLFAMYLLAVCVNAIGLLWSAGIAMRFRSLQAAPLMQLPIFLTLFFAPVFVPLAMLAHWLRLIAHVNPVTLFLEAGRGLISGSPTPRRAVRASWSRGSRPRRRSSRSGRLRGASRQGREPPAAGGYPASERLAHPGLEARDQLLAVREQPPLGDHAGARSALDELDELRVLPADLIVELQELLDPLLGRVRCEEVVEHAPSPIRREREDRADREVRAAREDVDPGVRPDEVELALGELALGSAAAPQLPELAPVPVAGRELVAVLRDVHELREAGVRDGAVVALEEVLAGDLPVGADLPVDAVVERERVDLEAGGGDPLGDVAEEVRERRRVVVQVDEAERVPRPPAARGRARARPRLPAPRSGAPSGASRRGRTSRRGTGTAASSGFRGPRRRPSRGAGRR